MNAFEIVLGIVLVLLAVIITAAVLMQEGKGGMGALTGEQSESFGRNAGKTLNTTMKNVTKIATIVFIVVIILVNVVSIYF